MSHLSPKSFRQNFPILQDTVYLSSCSLGARSKQLDQSLAAMLNAMSDGAGAWQKFEDQVVSAREKFAFLIGARADQIAIIPSASIGAYQIVSCIDWLERPKILTSMAEFPSIAHVWLAQRERGAHVTFARVVDERAYYDAIDTATGLVSVPIVSYSDGRKLDVKSITKAAHAEHSRVFVDAYQALGVEPVDVKDLNCDYLVAGASKYLLGLPGVAFLYERERRNEDHEPQLTGWSGRKDPLDFDPRILDFAENARRYEISTQSVPALYAANAGLDLLLDLDMRAVRKHISVLINHVQNRLADSGIEQRGPADSSLRGAHIAVYHPDMTSLEAHLVRAQIRVSPRNGLARIAFHYYNTIEDADTVCDQIAEYQSMCRHPQVCIGSEGIGDTLIEPASPGVCAQTHLERWCNAPNPAAFPYSVVMAAYQENGKEFVSMRLLDMLNAIRSFVPTLQSDPVERQKLERFLNVALDKFDDAYEYTSYCALPLWPLPTHPDARPDSNNIDVGRDRQLLALMADLLRFELNAYQGRTALMPDMRPGKVIYQKRVRRALNSAKFAIERLCLPVNYIAKDFEAEAEKFCEVVLTMLTPSESQALSITMQPVFTVHDEYMFLRILQSFEVNFAWIAVRLQSAIDVFQTDPTQVAPLIQDANRMYKEALKLFPVLTTMQRDAFHVFRDYTEGASAIQSRNYKLVESLCRAPDRERREGLAYTSVPEIRARVLNGQNSIDAALEAARSEDRLSPETDSKINLAMDAFSQTLQQWRQIHFRLAVKVLGVTTPGTGASEGTPYLRAVQSIPVFKSKQSEAFDAE